MNKYEAIRKSKAYSYALKCVDKTNHNVAKYVRMQAQQFIDMIEDEDNPYYINETEFIKYCNILKLINIMPNKDAYTYMAGFQWFFVVNTMLVRRKSNDRRRYELSVMLIGRKNGKTMISALFFMLAMLTGDKFAEYYIAAPDRDLSSQLKKELAKLIDHSPAVSPYFKTLRSETRCELTKSTCVPLAFSENRLDGRLASLFLIDETGALKNSYPIEALQSSQITLPEKFGIIISTAYDSLENPMTAQIEYCQKVFDGIVKDDTIFALIYKPDNSAEWYTDESLLQANPLAEEVEVIHEALLKKREKAINMPEALPNFKTKHLNIFMDGNGTEPFVEKEELQRGRIDTYDWQGRKVWLGVDLSMSDDNSAVAMVTYDSDLEKFVAKTWCFIPEGRIEEKTRKEKINYEAFVKQGVCIACDDQPEKGNKLISYRMIESHIKALETKYGVEIINIAYDRYNAIGLMQNLEDYGLDVIEQNQWGQWLHSGTKLFRETIIKGDFLYETNRLLEYNVLNAKLEYDNDLKMKINKKKSRTNSGKIDIADALINIFCTIDTEDLQGKSIYEEEGLLIF